MLCAVVLVGLSVSREEGSLLSSKGVRVLERDIQCLDLVVGASEIDTTDPTTRVHTGMALKSLEADDWACAFSWMVVGRRLAERALASAMARGEATEELAWSAVNTTYSLALVLQLNYPTRLLTDESVWHVWRALVCSTRGHTRVLHCHFNSYF